MSTDSTTILDASQSDEPIQSEAAKAPQAKPRAVKPHSRKNTSLIDAAVSHVSKFRKRETENEHSRRDMSFHAVAGIYVLLLEAGKNEEIRTSLIDASQIKPRGSKLSANYCVRAVLAISDFDLKSSTRWDWTRAVEALIISKVEANTHAAVDWFKRGEVFTEGKDELRGFEKAHAVVKRDKDGQPSNPGVEARLKNAQTKRTEVWNSFVEPQRENPLRRFDLGEQERDLPDGTFLLLVERKDSTLTLMNTTLANDAVLRKLIPKKQK
ncbi:hypothetical protein [Methylobacterium sp. WCS2018Hpa-22]|uniref:hypothetical protein n=1 Tax=Methylobacterium sp. WCS2018Hpa-22 TaxID=3073633 RepID=UPI00288B56B3|nr:hypothetical protein [Methylobacterium sp. WCS2018Hpa-22]